MSKFLLEFDEPTSLRFSEFLTAGEYGGYAGMVEVTTCDICSAVVTDIEHHLEGAHSA